MRAREILLALVIIAVGVFAHYAGSGKLGIDGRPFFVFGGEEYAFEEAVDIPGPLPEKLVIRNAHGGVDLKAGTADRITVLFGKRIVRRNKAEAQAVADKLKTSASRDGGRLVLSNNRDEFERRGFQTFYTVTVPPGLPVEVANSYGSVRVSGTGETGIENPHGEVRAEDIRGPFTLSSSYEAVSVRNAAAGIRLVCPHSDLTIEGVRGGAWLEHSYGEVSLRDVEGSVVVRGSHSQVKGTNLPGTVGIDSSYEDIVLSGTGPATIRGPHCGIEVKQASGAVSISGPYARIDVAGVGGDLKIDSPNSEVTAADVRAAGIDVSTTNQDVRLAGFTGRAKIRMTHGALTLEPLDLSGPVDVEAEYTDIVLTWPEGLRAPFEGLSRGGRVDWNLSERPDVEESNGQSLVKAFQIEAGRPGVRLSTSHGDIRIEPR